MKSFIQYTTKAKLIPSLKKIQPTFKFNGHVYKLEHFPKVKLYIAHTSRDLDSITDNIIDDNPTDIDNVTYFDKDKGIWYAAVTGIDSIKYGIIQNKTIHPYLITAIKNTKLGK